MRLNRGKVDHVDLVNDRRFQNLPEHDREWLVDAFNSSTPRIGDITSMLQRNDLTNAQRSILVALRKSLVGDMRAERGRAFTSEGSMSLTEVRARTLKAAQAPSGKTDLQRKVAEELPPSMLGHEDQVAPFVEYARRYQSPARQTLPLMAVVGNSGQGKEQGIDSFKSIVLGEEAEVVTIDLRDFGKAAAMPGTTGNTALFGKDGLLSPEVLKTRVEGYEPPPKQDDDDEDPPKVQPAIIVLKGVEGLQKNDPDMAAGLARLIAMKRSMPEYANVMVVLDFETDATEDPRQLVIDAIGAVGSRNLAATAAFKDLGGDELMSYAEPLLKDSLALPGLGNMVVEIDSDAEAALKRALATPHAPLEEMDQRLYEFLISKFDTQTNVDRDAAVLRVSLDPKFANNPAALDRMIEQLHEPFADLRLGSQLFVVNIVARQVESNADLEIALRHGDELVTQLQARSAQLAIGMPVVDAEAEASAAVVIGALSRLGDTFGKAMMVARKHFELTSEELLPPELGAELDEQIETLRAAIPALASEDAGRLPAAWRVAVGQLANRFAEAAQIVSDTLQGIPLPEPEPPPEAPAEEAAE